MRHSECECVLDIQNHRNIDIPSSDILWWCSGWQWPVARMRSSSSSLHWLHQPAGLCRSMVYGTSHSDSGQGMKTLPGLLSALRHLWTAGLTRLKESCLGLIHDTFTIQTQRYKQWLQTEFTHGTCSFARFGHYCCPQDCQCNSLNCLSCSGKICVLMIYLQNQKVLKPF